MNFSYKKLLVGLLFSGFFFLSIYWISNDFSGIWEVSKNADYFMVFIGLLFYSFSLLFRSFRWNYLLKNNSSKLSTRKLTPIVIVGYMFNNLLPIRTGEIARCFYLEHKLGVKKIFALGTVAIERISDVIALSLILGLTLILVYINSESLEFINYLPGNQYSFILFILLIFLASLLLIIAPFFRLKIYKIFDYFSRNSNVFIKKIFNFIKQFFDGYFSINNSSKLMKLLSISFLIWILEITMYFFIAVSVNLTLDSFFLLILTVLFFGTAANLAGIFPSTAGGWGSFDFFGVLVLISFGIDEQLSLGFVIFTHFFLWAPVTLIGMLIFLKDWIPLRKIKNI